jgi:hypothetical protein
LAKFAGAWASRSVLSRLPEIFQNFRLAAHEPFGHGSACLSDPSAIFKQRFFLAAGAEISILQLPFGRFIAWFYH